MLMLVPKTIAPRGIRNNNPGNIRRTGDHWQGLKSRQTDSEFFQFKEAFYGIRAMAVIIDNYKKQGFLTIDQIINRWAPSTENNTSAYIDTVYRHTKFPRGHVPLRSNGDYVTLIKAIIKHENGFNPYSDRTIKAGIMLS